MNRIVKSLIFIIVASCLFMPVAHAEEAFGWECVKEAGDVVEIGESIAYKLTVLESGATDTWATLTIRLGGGMVLDSFTYYGAEQINTPPGEEPPYIAREVIPGNDGCVILASVLQEGDVAIFTAHAEANDAEVTATAATGEYSSTVSHILSVENTPPEMELIPLATMTPEPETDMASEAVNPAATIAVVFAALIGVTVFVCYICRNKQWMIKLTSQIKAKLKR